MVFGQPILLWLLAAVALGSVVAWGVAHRRAASRAREELARAEEQARSLGELCTEKDRALKDTYHEVRTPLFGLAGMAESLLDEGVELPEKTRRTLALMAETGRRLAEKATEIADASHLDAGRLELNLVPTDLRACVGMVLALSRPLAELRGLELMSHVPKDLPAALADRERLVQILQHLVTAAMEDAHGGGTLTVTAKAEDDNLLVVVAAPIRGPVKDDDPPRRSRELVRRLVELHGGWMWSEAGLPGLHQRIFSLPITDAKAIPYKRSEILGRLRPEPASTDRAASSKPAEPPRPQDPFSPHRILVVDDDPTVRTVLVEQLLTERFEVVEASDGSIALDLLDREPFDLVILDVAMPGMSGYEVCRAVRRRTPSAELPIIFLTGLGDGEDLITGFAVGANDYLVKPAGHGDLMARVKLHLAGSSAAAYRRRLDQAVRSFEEERELRRRLFEVRERERRRLAQELHDGPIQDLQALALELSRRPETAHPAETCEAVASNLRSVCTELRPPGLMFGGLAGALRAHVGRLAARSSGIDLVTDLMDDGSRLTEWTRLHLFRIAQEALANAVQHAGASRIELRFELDAEGCRLEIRDDGHGFKVPDRWIDFSRRERFGLVGIAERTEILGGALEVSSEPGSGTAVRVDISSLALDATRWEEETLEAPA